MLKEEALMQKKLAVKRKALSMLQHTQARAVLMMILLVSLFTIGWSIFRKLAGSPGLPMEERLCICCIPPNIGPA